MAEVVAKYVERILIVLNPDSSVKGIAIDNATAIDGVIVRTEQIAAEDVTDLNAEKVLASLGASIGAEVLTLRASVATLTADRDKHATELAALRESTVAEAELATALTRELSQKLDESNQAKAAVTSKLTELKTLLPWNQRIINPEAFLKRVTQDELVSLLASPDETAKQIGELLMAYRTNNWPIELDDPKMMDAIGYLVHVGQLTDHRAKEFLADSRREESVKTEV